MDSLKPSSVKNPPSRMKPRKTSYKGDAAATRNSTGSTRQTEPGSLPSSRRYSSSGFGKDESYYYCSVQGCSKTFNSLEEVQSHMRNHQTKSSSDPKNPQQRYSARLRARSIRISDEKKLKESEATEAQAGASTSATTVATASEEAKAAGRKRTSEVETNSIKLNRIKKTSGDAKEEEAKVDIPESNDKPAAAVPATAAVEEESAAVATTTAPGQVSSIAATFLANSTPSRATRLSRTAKFSGDCPICSRTFLSKHGLWMHLTAYKTSELKCVKCSLDFQKHEGLMHHAYHVHAANKSVMTVVTPSEEAASITTPAAVTTATDATTDVTASAAQPETPLQAELKNNHVASATTDSTVVAAGDSDNKEVVDDMDCGGEEDKQQQQQGVVGGEEAAMESGGDQSVDGSSVPSPPSTIASTGNNEQPPRSTSALTVTSNNRPPASKRFKKSDYVHGFDDLADHDFSSSVFTSIAEMMCNKNPHLLMEKNGHYVFHCKLCDILFPCLDVLDQHFVRRHPEHIADIEAIKTGKQPAPKEEVDGAVVAAAQPEPQQAPQVPEAAEEKMQVDGAAEEKEGEKAAAAEEENMQVDEGSSGNKENEEKAADVDDDVSEFGEEETVGNEFNPDDPNSEPSDEVLQMLGLKRVEDEEKAAQLARENKQPETAGITYGMDNDFVFTSPAPGFHKQPTWMRSENSGSLVIPDKRYISQYATNGSASQSNTNNMLKLYGIQISTGRNGKKTYWCRMCDYNSFEKSTILRHQRTHTGIRPFTCRDCNYSFTTKANCERHIKKRHVEILEREGVDAKSLVVANDEQIKRLREGGYGLKDPNFAPNGANGRQRHRPYSSKCLVCSMIFSSHSNCVRHLVREHGVPEDRATERLMNILPSTSGTPISTSPTDTAHVYYSAAESDERVDYQSGTSTPVAPNMNNNDEGGGDNNNNNGGNNNDMSRDQLEGYFDSFLQQGEEAGNKDPESVEDGKWRRRTLTPLAKITAFNAAAAKIREYFERDYASVLAQFNINSSGSNGGVQPSIPQVRSKLFSLLTSTAHSVTTAAGINRNKHRVGGGVRGGAVGSSHHPTAMLRTGATAVPSAASASPYGARPMHTTLKRPFPKQQQQQQNDINFRPIKPKRKRSMQQDPSMPGTSTGMTRDQLIDICNDSHDGGDESDHLAAAGSGLSRNPVTSQENIARGFISNSKSKFVKVKKNIHMLQASKLPHFAASSFQSLPTMVGMSSKFGTAGAPVVPNGVAASSSTAAAAVGRDPNDRRLQPPRKCPKCPKSFQWSSSHRRHVATHTGLKPYMCSHCNMRFTTRSNLLRHAYRRHDVDRSSADRSSVVVNLSRDEQERFAEIEARTFEEQQHDVSAEEQDGNNTENQDTTADEPSNALSIVEHNSYDESLAASQSGESSMFDQTPSYSSMFEPATIITSSAIDRTPSTPVTPQTSSFTSAKIKKYLCGKCNVPFANRSNVVRHLAKQHHITKDHKNFKSLLVKIDGSFVVERRNRNNRHNHHHHHQDSPSMVTNSSLFDTTPNHSAAGSRSLGMMNSPHAATPVSIPKPSKLSATAASSTPLPPTKVSVVTTPVMKLEPPTGPVASTSARYIAPKEFKCTICNMGFTKRNNAARHVQQQHQIKRTGLGKSNFVVRINEEGDELETSNMSQAAADPTTTTADVTNDDEAKEGAQTAAVGEVAGKRRKITNPFSCGFCKRIFENVDKLKEHIVVHQTPHPWECPLCSTPFTSKYNCQRHLGRRHGRLDLTPLFVGGENELFHDDGGVLMSNDDDQVLDLSTYSSSNFQPTSLYIAATTTEQQQQQI